MLKKSSKKMPWPCNDAPGPSERVKGVLPCMFCPFS